MPGIVAKGGTQEDKRLIQKIMTDVDHTIDAYSAWYNNFLRMHRMYLSANESQRRPEPTDIDNAEGDWRAQLFSPRSFGTVEAALPGIYFNLFGVPPFVKMVGREESDIPGEEIATGLLHYDMMRARVPYKFVLNGKSLLKYGVTTGKVTWRKQVKMIKRTSKVKQPIIDPMTGTVMGHETVTVIEKKPQKLFDGPWYDPVSVFDAFPDPLYYQIEDMRYFAEHENTSLSRLRQINKEHMDASEDGKPLYKNLDQVTGLANGAARTGLKSYLDKGDAREETAAIIGGGSRGGRSLRGRRPFLQGPGSEDVPEEEVWLVHHWTPERFRIVANGVTVILDEENPFNGELPYITATPFPIEFEYFGLGYIQPVAGLQEELNALRTLFIDQTKLNVVKPIAYDPDADIGDEDFEVSPGSTHTVKFEGGRPLAAPLYPRDSAPPDIQIAEGFIQSDWNQALGMNPSTLGGGPTGADTASEAGMMNASVNARQRLQSFLVQEQFLIPLARKFFARRQQFHDEEEVIRIMGRKGFLYPTITRGDLQGQYDYEAAGALTGPNLEVERAQLNQLIVTLANNDLLSQKVNWDVLLEEVVTRFTFRDPLKVLAGPHRHSIDGEQLEKLLLIARQMGDKKLEDSVLEEIEARAAQEGQGGITSGEQQVQGGMQGAGDVAAEPTPSSPEMIAEVFGGSGGPVV